jgi:hypothetical protein
MDIRSTAMCSISSTMPLKEERRSSRGHQESYSINGNVHDKKGHFEYRLYTSRSSLLESVQAPEL